MYQFPQILQKLMECHPTYRRRITQKELAEHVGVRPQTVSLYLKGETAPSPRLLLKGSFANVGVVKSICKQVQTAAYQGSNHGISATGGFTSHGYSCRNRVSFVN